MVGVRAFRAAGGGENDPEHDFWNISITLANGKKYALNVWSYKFFDQAVRESRDDAFCLYGKYLLPPDLFVERFDRQTITEVVADLIKRDSLLSAWRAGKAKRKKKGKGQAKEKGIF